MKTSMGKGCADVFDTNALEQIRDWASNAVVMLDGEAKRLHQSGEKLSVVKEYLSDQMDFEQLVSSLNTIIQHKNEEYLEALSNPQSEGPM